MDKNEVIKAMEGQLKELDGALEKKISEANKSLENSVSDKVEQRLKDEVKTLSDAREEQVKKLQDGIDALDAKIQNQGPGEEQKSFGDMLEEKVSAEEFRNKWGEHRSASLFLDKLTGKAVGTMTEANSLTGEVIPPTRRESVVELAQRATHVRNLLPQGTMTGNTYRFVQETAGEGGAGMTAEGVEKNQVDYDMGAQDAPVRKITAFTSISEEMLDDIPALRGFLSRRLSKDLRKKEDNQLLYGPGSGQNLTGLTINAASFSAVAADSNAQIIDLLIQVYAQLESNEYEANGVLLSPRDYYTIQTTKDADGSYVKNDLVTTNGGQLFIAGIPVFRNTALSVGEYVVGDWLNASQIFDRVGVNIRFYEQDKDNVRKNLVTVVAEERLAFPIFYPDAYVYGTLTTDINKIKNYTP